MIIEDGTGIANANSYVTTDEADEYFAALGNTEWYADEAALVVGSQVADLLYGRKYLGCKNSATQGLMFPRTWFTDNDGFIRENGEIPVELKKAVMELALLHLKGEDVMPDADGDTLLQEHTVKLDVLEETKVYFAPAGTKQSRKVDLLLKPILTKTASQRKIIRG